MTSDDDVSVLHVGDLHLGVGEMRDEDLKHPLPDAERPRLVDRFETYLKALKAPPDFAVFSGDFTNRGDYSGFKDSLNLMIRLSESGVLPPPKRIIVVPGNHDVTQGVKEYRGWHAERYKGFFQAFGTAFPHAYIPDCDPPLKAEQPAVPAGTTGVVGGIEAIIKYGQSSLVKSHPFILDLDRHVLIFAFNSTLGCGVYSRGDKNIKEDLAGLGQIFRDSRELKPVFDRVSDAYNKSLIEDAGLIGREQLSYFDSLVRRLRMEIGDEHYAALTKFAVLHHHIGHLYAENLELKRFESVVDASQLKQYLVEADFDFVLHGHKHVNHVSVDATIIPIAEERRLNPLCVVSGGTVAGYPPPPQRRSFKLIELEGKTGPRKNATIREVPLLDTHDPLWVMRSKETRVYQASITARFPGVHDLKKLKDRLDQDLLERLGRELGEPAKRRGPDRLTLPRGNPNITNGPARFKFLAGAEHDGTCWWFDVFLATEKLDFRQRARVFWMLTDLANLQNDDRKKHKAVLIVGDMTNTHFGGKAGKEEVAASVQVLREWFKPAIDSHFFEIRVHNYEASDVVRLGLKVEVEESAEGGGL